MTDSARRTLGLATMIMMGSVFLSRVIGYFREATIAAVAGTGVPVEAYKTAFVLPEILNHVLASGFLSVTFIPIFSRYLADGDENGGWRALSNILSVFGAVLAVLVAGAMGAASWLMPLAAPGRDDPLFVAMTVRMTRILLPAQLFFFAGGLFMAAQFARKRFLLPALSPLIYNLGIIAGGLLLGPYIGMEGFAWGALAGAAVGSFGLQIYGACKVGLRLSFCFAVRHPDLRRYVLLTLPLAVGLTMVFSVEIFSKFFGSFLEPRAIAWIDYAWRIIMMLVGFFGQAVGVASFPFLASLAAENRIEEMNRLFNDTLRYLILVVPVAVLMLVCRQEIVRILFERYAFSAHDTRMTALALAGMLTGAAAFSAQTVVNRGFYAVQNTLTPAVYGTVAVALCLPVYWFATLHFGVLGFGAAVSISAFVQVGLLFSLWNRRSGNRDGRAVYRFFARIMLLSLVMGVILTAAYKGVCLLIQPQTAAGSLAVIGVLSALFLLLAIVLARVFHVDEALYLLRRLAGVFRRNNSI